MGYPYLVYYDETASKQIKCIKSKDRIQIKNCTRAVILSQIVQ